MCLRGRNRQARGGKEGERTSGESGEGMREREEARNLINSDVRILYLLLAKESLSYGLRYTKVGLKI